MTEDTADLTAEQIADGWKCYDETALNAMEAGTVVEIVSPHGKWLSGYVEDMSCFQIERYRVFEPVRASPPHDQVEALRLVIAYDDLLRKYEGPAVLFDGDVAEIDAAYDAMVAAARASQVGEAQTNV